MYAQHVWAWALAAAAGYLLGSFSGAITASRRFHKTDIRQYGSGNAGMTNALRTFGAKTAVWVSVMDAAKTVAALAIGRWLLGDMGLIAAGSGALIGHAFPLYYQFKGGKCVLSGAVIVLWMDWRVFAVIAVCFLGFALATKIVAVGSIAAAAAIGPATWIFVGGPAPVLVFACCLSVFVIALHHSNIRRLIEKRELRAIGGQKKEEQP